jgi:hypothetical protein
MRQGLEPLQIGIVVMQTMQFTNMFGMQEIQERKPIL